MATAEEIPHAGHHHLTASIKGRHMAKKRHEKKRQAEVQVPPGAARPEAGAGPPPKMKRKEYERRDAGAAW